MKKSIDYHPVVDQIMKLLDEGNYWYELFEHAPVRTSEEAHAIRTGYTLSQGAKALILNITRPKKPGNYQQSTMSNCTMLVVPGDKRFDRDKVRKLFGGRKFRFATKEEVAELTEGVKPGGIPPFGNLFNLDTYADNSLFENNKIIFNAGDPRISIGLNVEDYKSLANPQIAEIV